MKIVLESKVLIVEKIIKKTQAEMFKKLKVGDKILLYVEVKAAGHNRGTYATGITIKNLKTGEITMKTFNQINSVLDRFEFKEEVGK